MEENKFSMGDHVYHRKTKTFYRIEETPDLLKLLEYNRESYYKYSDGVFSYIRCKSEMEDGRFLLK